MMPAMIKLDCRSLIHVLEFNVLGVAIFDQKTLKVFGLLTASMLWQKYIQLFIPATVICHIDTQSTISLSYN